VHHNNDNNDNNNGGRTDKNKQQQQQQRQQEECNNCKPISVAFQGSPIMLIISEVHGRCEAGSAGHP